MDKIDKSLLFELNWNCRQSDNAIAKRLRTSKQVINYRLKKLEKEGIITGYSALIDWRKLGYNAFRVYLKWKNINPEIEAEIYEEVRKNPLFMWTMKFEGEFDFAVYVWSKNTIDLYEKWNVFFKKYKKYVLKQEICESVNMIHYPLKFLTEKKDIPEKIIGIGEEVKIDEKDNEIIDQISSNARISIVDLTQKIRLTPKAIIYRLRNLEKKGVLIGYNAIIDFKKLDLEFYKVDFYLNDLSKLNKMYYFSKEHRKIIYAMKTFGGPDYEIEILVKNAEELNKIISEIKTEFSDVIEYSRIHFMSKTIKQVYLPGKSLTGK